MGPLRWLRAAGWQRGHVAARAGAPAARTRAAHPPAPHLRVGARSQDGNDLLAAKHHLLLQVRLLFPVFLHAPRCGL